MANGRVEYVIGFKADTIALKKAVEDAKKSLESIGNLSIGQPITQELLTAQKAAVQLKTTLEQSTTNIGTIDLSKFNQALQQSKKTIEQYGNELVAIGPQGTEAFLQVANAISRAELPIKRTSVLLDKLWTTFTNNIRWQIVTKGINTFTGALHTAYGYSKDLNRSLNSIQIVTNKSAQQMAQFRKEANAAAKTLNTDTVSYTDATLTYFQQGLSDEQVKNRADTTIKLANVSRQEASEVSDQMTSIWNNFDDGSKSLEYYADVITALGAATASSSEEIATGLQKFSAVAKQIGLSYDYATAALATVTAATRESVDITSNSFKTLFARIQGLQQDETQDDGTTLNKYSQALMNVGINIKTTSNQMKDMNDILDEMGSKWDTLTKAEQLALAQTVAGVRQYSQLIALMNNYDDFKENVNIARKSEGALERQAEIYAKSWEAARDRVRASAEDVYDSLINSDLYISLDNALSPVLKITGQIIDGLGGLEGILTTVAFTFSKLYGDKMAENFRNIAHNIKIITGREQEHQRVLKESIAIAASNAAGNTSSSSMGQTDRQQQRVLLQIDLNRKTNQLSEKQIEEINNNIQLLEILEQQRDTYDEIIERSKELAENTKQKTVSFNKDISVKTDDKEGLQSKKNLRDTLINEFGEDFFGGRKGHSNIIAYSRVFDAQKLQSALTGISKYQAQLKALQTQLIGFDKTSKDATVTLDNIKTAFNKVSTTPLDFTTSEDGLQQVQQELDETETQINLLIETLTRLAHANMDPENVKQYLKTISNAAAQEGEGAFNSELMDQLALQLGKTIKGQLNETKEITKDWAYQLTNITQSITGIISLTVSLHNLGSIWTNENLSSGEKFFQTLTSLSMILYQFLGLLAALKQSYAAQLITEKLIQASSKSTTLHKTLEAIAYKFLAKAKKEDAAASAASLVATAAIIAALMALAGIIKLITMLYQRYQQIQQQNEIDNRALANSIEALSEKYSEAKKEAEEFKTAISEYQDGLKAIKELEENTEKFKETLSDTNDQATALINKYKLFDQYSYGEKGEIIISDAGIEAINKKNSDTIYDTKGQLLQTQLMKTFSDERLASEKFRYTLQKDLTENLVYISGKFSDQNVAFITEWVKQNSLASLQDFIQLIDLKFGSDYQNSEQDFVKSDMQIIFNAFKDNVERQDSVTKTIEFQAKQILKNEVSRQQKDNAKNLNEDNKTDRTEQYLNILTNKLLNEHPEFTEDNYAYQSITNKELSERYNLGIHRDEDLARYYAQQFYNLSDEELKEYTYKKGNGVGDLTKNGQSLFGEMLSDDVMRSRTIAMEERKKAIEALELDDASLKIVDDLMNDIDKASKQNFNQANIGSVFLDALVNESIPDPEKIFAFLSPENVEKIRQTNGDIDLLTNLLGIDKDKLDELSNNQGASYIKGFYNGIVNHYDPSEFYKRLGQTGEEFSRTIYDKVQKGDLTYKNIVEDEDYKNLLQQLEQLVQQYPELEAAQIELSKLWNVGTQSWIEALEIVQDKFAELDIKGKILNANKLNEELSNLKIDSDLDTYQEKLNNFLNAEYELNITIHTQAEQEFNSIINAVQDIEKQASLIGEDFIVAAGDIRELNNTFPGILQNLTYLNDGTIQLSKESVQAAIEGAKIEVAKDTEATVNKLRNQATLLRMKQSTYQTMADAAKQLATAETLNSDESAKLQGTIDAGLNKLKTTNDEITTNAQLQHQSEVATGSQTNANIMFNNYKEAYEKIAQLSYEVAVIQQQNLQAGIDPSKEATTGNFTVDYKGSSGTAEAASITQAEAFLKVVDSTVGAEQKEAYEKLYLLFQNQANFLGRSANDIDGMITSVVAQATESFNKFSNVGARKDSNSSNKQEEKFNDELDRYHEINRAIKQQNDLLDETNNKLERAYGKNKLEVFEKKIQQLQKQQENYKNRLAESEEYLKSDTAKLNDLFKDVQINEQGELVNRKKMLTDAMEEYKQAVDNYNNFIKNYNTMSKTQQEASKDKLEALEKEKQEAKELYDLRTKAVDQYEKTIDEIREDSIKLAEITRNEADEKLKKIKYELEIVISVKDMKDSLRELNKKINESFGDTLTHGLNSIKLSEKQAAADMQLLQEYQDQYDKLNNELLNNPNANKEQIIEDITNIQKEAINLADSLIEYWNGIEDYIPNAIAVASERYSKFIDQLEHDTTILDSIKELYALQGLTYKTQEGFYRLQKTAQTKMDAQLAQAQLQKTWYDEAQVRFQEAQARLDSLNGDEEDPSYDLYKKERDALLEQMNEAEEAYLSKAKETMETAKEMYEEQLEKAMYDFGKILTGGLGLDFAQEKFDHYIDTEERYFDKVNEAYKTTAWYNKLQQDIDKTTNSVAANRLKALQEEIDIRRQNNKLSKYDLDILNAKYEVLKAQMALEDAQNAKNQLQLVRDSQGNWNYQYSANPDDIENAEQKIFDAENNWYNIAKDQVKETNQKILENEQELVDKIKEVYNDLTLTTEEREARIAEIKQYYGEKDKYLKEELQIAIADMNEAGNANLLAASVLMGDKLTDLTGVISQDIYNTIQQGNLNIIDLLTADSETIKEIVGNNTTLINSFENTYAEDLGKMTNNNVDFQKELDRILSLCEDNFTTFESTVNSVASSTGTSVEELGTKIKNTKQEIDYLKDAGIQTADALWKKIDRIIEVARAYDTEADSIWGVVEAYKELARIATNTIENYYEIEEGENGPDRTYHGGSYVSSSKSKSDDFDTESSSGSSTFATAKTGVQEYIKELSKSTYAIKIEDDNYNTVDWVDSSDKRKHIPIELQGYLNKGYDLQKAVEFYLAGLSANSISWAFEGTGLKSDYDSTNNSTNKKILQVNAPNAEVSLGTKFNYDNSAITKQSQNIQYPAWYEQRIAELRAQWDSYNDVTKNALTFGMTGGSTFENYIKFLQSIGKFDTGGYTGEFQGAKLAFLHQKELVLNKEDTENILSAVKINRDLFSSIEKVLDGNGVAAMALMGEKLGTAQIRSAHDSIEQTIHIDQVSFPNISSPDGLEEAFISIANDAVQWARRRTE